MQRKVSSLEEKVKKIYDYQINPDEKKLTDLTNPVEKKLTDLEDQSSSNNLRICGIPE